MKLTIFFAFLGVTLALPTGLVGPSGVIGPSGLVGPSGSIQFGRPAAAHDHLAGLKAHRAAINAVLAAEKANVLSRSGTRFEVAPVSLVQGIDSKGCVVGPSGKVCPTGNIQFIN